jgi:hypothetical protein
MAKMGCLPVSPLGLNSNLSLALWAAQNHFQPQRWLARVLSRVRDRRRSSFVIPLSFAIDFTEGTIAGLARAFELLRFLLSVEVRLDLAVRHGNDFLHGRCEAIPLRIFAFLVVCHDLVTVKSETGTRCSQRDFLFREESTPTRLSKLSATSLI